MKAFESGASALKHLDGFIQEHAFCFMVGIIGLWMVLLARVLSGGLRHRFKQRPEYSVGDHRAIAGIPTAPEESFNPFRPLRECDHDHDHDDGTD